MEAEMMGKPAISLKMIVDQHVITTEILQSFAPLVSILNIPVDLQKITSMGQFRPVLKEMNQKKNGIF
jgi:hypothetical protein